MAKCCKMLWYSHYIVNAHIWCCTYCMLTVCAFTDADVYRACRHAQHAFIEAFNITCSNDTAIVIQTVEFGFSQHWSSANPTHCPKTCTKRVNDQTDVIGEQPIRSCNGRPLCQVDRIRSTGNVCGKGTFKNYIRIVYNCTQCKLTLPL